MDKPFSIVRDEFLTSLVDLVNNSGLPPSVTADVLASVHQLMMQTAQAQLERDLAEWEASQAEKEGE